MDKLQTFAWKDKKIEPIVTATTTAAENIVGIKLKQKRYVNNKINLRMKRNKIITKIHNLVNTEETNKMGKANRRN